MRKLLLAAVTCLSLLAIALPGPALAGKGGNKGGNKTDVRVCRTQFDDLGYKNRGTCARAFTQAPDGFAEACAAAGGFVERYALVVAIILPDDAVEPVPACSFGDISSTQFAAVFTGAPWRTLCGVPAYGFWYHGAVVIGCDVSSPSRKDPKSKPDDGFEDECTDADGSLQRNVAGGPWSFSAACVWSAAEIGDEDLGVIARPLLSHCSNGLRWVIPVGDSALAGCPDTVRLVDSPDDPMIVRRS